MELTIQTSTEIKTRIKKISDALLFKNRKNNDYQFNTLLMSIEESWPSSDDWDDIKAISLKSKEFLELMVLKELSNLMSLDGDIDDETYQWITDEFEDMYLEYFTVEYL